MNEVKETEGYVSWMRGRAIKAKGQEVIVTDFEINKIVIGTFKPGTMQVGDYVKVEYTQNGQYNNAQKILILGNAAPGQTKLTGQKEAPKTAAPVPVGTNEAMSFWTSVKIAAIAMNAKVSVSELLKYAEEIRKSAPGNR